MSNFLSLNSFISYPFVDFFTDVFDVSIIGPTATSDVGDSKVKPFADVGF